MKNGIIIGGVKIMFAPEQIEKIRAALFEANTSEVKKKCLKCLMEVPEGEVFKLGTILSALARFVS